MSYESNREGAVTEAGGRGADWTEPRSPDIPAPTYWPAVAAFSVVAALFGILTSWTISAVGLVMFAVSMSHWMGELNRDE